MGAISGSREPSQSLLSRPVGFDPERVRVTAADYNGRSWDGSPFSHVPKWLETALRHGAVTIKEDDRDYALWAVETPSGTKIAEPGDDIVCLDGHLNVQKERWLDAIAAGSGTAETNADSAQCEASQSGAESASPKTSPESNIRSRVEGGE